MTRQEAINAHCCACIYDPAEPGTWRKQTQECTVEKCPLYNYRPVPVGASRDTVPEVDVKTILSERRK